jgi:hypothetical protein
MLDEECQDHSSKQQRQTYTNSQKGFLAKDKILTVRAYRSVLVNTKPLHSAELSHAARAWHGLDASEQAYSRHAVAPSTLGKPKEDPLLV